MRLATWMGAAMLMMLSSTASAQSVSYDYDKSVDFSGLKTYAWVPGTNLSDGLNHKRIVDAVDRQLAAKGLRKVEVSENPDVVVAYHALFGKNVQVTGLSSGWAGYRFGPNRWGTARVEQIVTGTLVVDIANPKTKTIVWRGIATKDVDVKADPEKRERNINKAAEKLFKKYPPKSKEA